MEDTYQANPVIDNPRNSALFGMEAFLQTVHPPVEGRQFVQRVCRVGTPVAGDPKDWFV